MVKLAKASKQATPKKKAPPPPKEEESSEEESSEEEEEEAPPPKKAAPAKAPVKAVKNGNAAKKPESEEEDDDDDDSEEEESEEEAPPPKPAAKATPAKATPAKAPPAKAEESDEDDDDDDDDDDEEESEEEAPPPAKGKAAPAKAPVKAAPAKEESEDDDDDDDDEDDSEEEEMDTTPAAPAKKAGMVKAKEESEEEDDDDEDDDDDEEDDDEDAPAAPAKRKADAKKETPPAKKAKADGEGFCLFVGNLNPNKEYDEIKDALRKFFTKNELEIVEVRLGGSKRFGYVEFSSEEDLEKALELNGKKVLGMEMKLDKAKSKENSQAQKSERDAKTLFVKNLPFAATSDDLKEIFDEAVDIRLPLGQNGSNRGIAYIEFKSEGDAEKYLEKAQGTDVQGRSILVDFVGQKSQQNKGGSWGAAAAGAPCKTLMVNNVAFSATEDVLQQAFEKSVSIRIPQNNGRSKGFAFVEFENEDDAKEAMESVNNTEIEGRTVRIEYSQQMGNRRESGGQGFKSGPTKTLFVKGLNEDTTDETLRDSFEGAVGARIVTDRDTGSSKGFGFVDFDNETDCQAAKEAMEEGEIDGNRVTLDYAKPKGEGGFRGGRGGGGFGGGGFRGGRGGGGFGGGRGGRGGGGFGGRGGGGRGGRGGGGRGGGRGFGGGGRGGGGGFGKPQGKKIKFDD